MRRVAAVLGCACVRAQSESYARAADGERVEFIVRRGDDPRLDPLQYPWGAQCGAFGELVRMMSDKARNARSR